MIMCVKLIAGNSCHSSVNFPPFTKVSTVFVTSVFRVFLLKENPDLLNEQLKTCSLDLSGTDELTIRHAFGTPSGYEIGDSTVVSGCGSICNLSSESTFARCFTEQ